ncbi:MAG: hypothetical protein EOL87_09055 [Spartobacteria bacterium]|nr:hypothetical protein [Spartobacteria bacterium]
MNEHRPVLAIDQPLKVRCPDYCVGMVWADVANGSYSAALWKEMDAVADAIRGSVTLPDIKNHPHIHATRKAYKKCGKDPNRYRPAAEALRRRVIQGKGLNTISILVDLVNLLSLKTGYSIGGFDLDKIHCPMRWGIGEKNEPYHGIGRGALNIEGLPTLRDNLGAIATPTSDEKRTRIHLSTKRMYININAYDGEAGLQEAIDYAMTLLENFAQATDVVTDIC